MMVVPGAKSIEFISSLVCLLYLPRAVLVGSCLLTPDGPADTGCSEGSEEEPQALSLCSSMVPSGAGGRATRPSSCVS